MQGLELSDLGIAVSEGETCIRRHCGTIEDMLFAERTGFDVAVVWHVKEHVQYRMHFLKL